MHLSKKLGVLLLLLSFICPLYLGCNWFTSKSDPLDVSLPSNRQSIELPVELSSDGTYLLSVSAQAGSDEESTRWLLGWHEYNTPKNFSHLTFQWKLLHQTTVIGQGNYADESQFFSGFTSAPGERNQIVGGEFAWISKLKRGQYSLEITNLKVPSKLALAHPRLQMKMHSPEYDFIGAYVLFFEVFFTLISGIAGTILLVRSRRRP